MLINKGNLMTNNKKIMHSTCPHDCPSTCALDVEVIDEKTIGRIKGSKDNDYTDGVICAKVARYNERIHHKDRLTQPMKRIGKKGSGDFIPIGWDEAMDRVTREFIKAEKKYGSSSIWLYYYAGTMGLVMRDGINRLGKAKSYSSGYDTFCTTLSWTGYIAGTGSLHGVSPLEMEKSDVIVIWGTNPVNTQVNVMSHAIKARKNHNAKIIIVDIYQNASMKQADMAICLRPGTDGALACAAMHIAFRDGNADMDYMQKYTDCPIELKQHLIDKTPEWAAKITGLTIEQIEAFAKLITSTKKCYFRLGYGFSRSKNGAVNMHAVLSIPAVTGAWAHEGGGAFHSNSHHYNLDKTMIEGKDINAPSRRLIDQCRIGDALLGNKKTLDNGAKIAALFIQNNNPMCVAPNQNKVRQGLMREDLFTCVHEQFMTDTAKMADIILPATMFLEHDDIYQAGGHHHIMLGKKAIEPLGQCRSNHDVICDLARRLGVDYHDGFNMTPRQHIDWMLKSSKLGDFATIEKEKWIICKPDFAKSHFIDGFYHDDGKFHFKADWSVQFGQKFAPDDIDYVKNKMPSLPDHWNIIEETTVDMPFRLATSPARNFLNSTFSETKTSIKNEARPSLLIHPDDAIDNDIKDGQLITIGNERGQLRLHAKIFSGLQRGVVISEGLWPNSSFIDKSGINTLTSASPGAPVGGGCFHDNHIWIKP